MQHTLSLALNEAEPHQTSTPPKTQRLGSRSYDEKRDFIRMRVNTEAVIVDTNGKEISAFCHNLSGGGALLEVKESFPVNHKVQIIIHSQYGHAPMFSSAGSVVRSLKKGSEELYLVAIRY